MSTTWVHIVREKHIKPCAGCGKPLIWRDAATVMLSLGDYLPDLYDVFRGVLLSGGEFKAENRTRLFFVCTLLKDQFPQRQLKRNFSTLCIFTIKTLKQVPLFTTSIPEMTDFGFHLFSFQFNVFRYQLFVSGCSEPVYAIAHYQDYRNDCTTFKK